jgi:hypothetical protein
VPAAGAHPDHDTIAGLRRRHLAALAGRFVAALRRCRPAGPEKPGHVVPDSTSVRASAPRYEAMSHGRMEEKEREPAAEVERLLAEAEKSAAGLDTI